MNIRDLAGDRFELRHLSDALQEFPDFGLCPVSLDVARASPLRVRESPEQRIARREQRWSPVTGILTGALRP
jgi:hypothetical protein